MNTVTPLVSIILPTYNRPDYLHKSLSSAVNQIYKNIEILVSDNSSPQNPQPIIDEFADPRIKFFQQCKNVGAFTNVIGTFQKAQGKYVACLLDDDLWEPQYLSEMVPVLEENPEAVLAFCDHYMMNEDGQINTSKTEECSRFYGRKTLEPGLYQPFHELALVSQSVSPAFAAVMRRDAIDWTAIPPQVGLIWDTYLAYLYSATEKPAYYVPARLTRCREHGGTITQQSGSRNLEVKLSKAEGNIFCHQTYLADQRLAAIHPYIKKRLASHLTTYGIALMRKQEAKKARSYFWRSLQVVPQPKTITALCLSLMPARVASKF